jgi:hypothetical protein
MKLLRSLHASCIVLALLAPACQRHVVLDPQIVPSRNDPEWTIRSEPSRRNVVASSPPPGAVLVTPAPSQSP